MGTEFQNAYPGIILQQDLSGRTAPVASGTTARQVCREIPHLWFRSTHS